MLKRDTCTTIKEHNKGVLEREKLEHVNEDRMEYDEINRTYNRRFIDTYQKEMSIDRVTQTEKLPENGIQTIKLCGGKHRLSSVYTITYWLSVRLPYGDILHSLTYAGIR